MLCAAGLAASCFVAAPDSRGATPFFLKQTGGFYHYVRETSTTFTSIRDRIESGYYSSRGVRNLAIYCPYRATEEWRGVPALDHFSTNPNTGSVADFADMVSTAHAHGMGVIIYVGLLFVHFDNDIWIKAQADYKAGRDTEEVGIFRWADDEEGETQTFGSWQYSDVAGAYYAGSWGHPAVDLAQVAGRDYVKKVMKFWLDLGVDGFEYDSPESFWGQTDDLIKQLLITDPNAYGQKYLLREGGTASYLYAEDNDRLGFTHVVLSGDDDARSVATDVMNGDLSVDGLEQHFQAYLDARREAGRGSKAFSIYATLSPSERALEAAVLAGNGAFMEIDYDEIYVRLDSESQRRYDEVFVALARSTAEAPGASRQRLPAGPSDRYYAVLRTSPAGGARALNVYNFTSRAGTVEVDLRGSGIMPGDVPLDLVTNQPADAVSGAEYQVSLPALGYALLGFGEDPPGAGGSDDGPDASAGRASGAGGSSAAGNGGARPAEGGSGPKGGSPSSGAGGPGSAGASTSSAGDASSPAPPSSSVSSGCGCSTVPSSGGAWVAFAAALLVRTSMRRIRTRRVS